MGIRLGWAMASTIGMWLGTVIGDDLRHGWLFGRLASGIGLVTALTLATNYAHSRRN